MNLITYADRMAQVAGLAGEIVAGLRLALAVKGRASLSVPGGTSPGPVFDLLAQADLDWSRVAVLLNDERWVDEASDRSNTRLLRERLLVGRAAAAHLVPLYAPAPEPEAMLAALAAGIAPHLPLDVLMLGMGADMHTASLFPGADLLTQALAADAPVLMALRAQAAGEPRITLTAPVLRGAGAVHILITGIEKRVAIERAAALPPDQAPVALVLDRARIHWAE
jgi:6-phosphogluconolactonase